MLGNILFANVSCLILTVNLKGSRTVIILQVKKKIQRGGIYCPGLHGQFSVIHVRKVDRQPQSSRIHRLQLKLTLPCLFLFIKYFSHISTSFLTERAVYSTALSLTFCKYLVDSWNQYFWASGCDLNHLRVE